MDKYRQELLDEYTDKINKAGMGIEELTDLRNRMIDVVDDDYKKTMILGLDELSQQRGNFKYGKGFNPDVDDIPSSIQEVKSDLAKLKTIMIDPSATPEGAQHIVDYMSKYAGRELSPEETINLVKILGRAQKKGMKSTKEFMYGKTSFEDIVTMVEKDKMTDEEIDQIAENLSNKYAEDVGLGVKKAPPSIVRPTPKVRGKGKVKERPEGNQTTKTFRPNVMVRNTSNKSSSTRVENKKVRLSEQSVHKHRTSKSIKVKPKAKRGN